MSNVEEFRSITLASGPGEGSGFPAADFDPSRYSADMEEFDLTEEQERELLATLWSIMRSFVELGFEGDVGSTLFPEVRRIPGTDELG